MKLRAMTLLCCILALSSIGFADEKRYDVPLGDSPSFGPHDAPVTLIEFIDFQ